MSDCDFWEKSCLIYAITNLINGMQYVGQTINKLKRRIGHHKKYNTSYLGNAIRQYGWENFKVDILEECKTPNGYNMTDGGNVPRGRVVSEHERKLRAEINPYKRAVRCIDTGEIFPSVMSVERRFKVGHSTISAVCRGKQITAAGYRFEYVENPLSLEEKLRQPQKPHTRKVRCIELNQIFNTINEASKKCNTNASHITRVCRGQRFKAGGYHWQYVD